MAGGDHLQHECRSLFSSVKGGSKSRVYWRLGSLMTFEEILKIIDAELDGG